MQVRLNLATKPLETHRRFLVSAGLLGAVASVVFLSLGWYVHTSRKADAERRAKSADMLRQMEILKKEGDSLERFFARDENAKLHDRSVFLNSIVHARSFNWTLMFMDLEGILPSGVRIVSVEPKQENGRVEVKLTVGATTDDAKNKFLKALEDSTTFSHIELNNVRAATPGTIGDQIVVELTAEYART